MKLPICPAHSGIFSCVIKIIARHLINLHDLHNLFRIDSTISGFCVLMTGYGRHLSSHVTVHFLNSIISPFRCYMLSIPGGKPVCNLIASRQRSHRIVNPIIPITPSVISTASPGLKTEAATRGNPFHIA